MKKFLIIFLSVLVIAALGAVVFFALDLKKTPEKKIDENISFSDKWENSAFKKILKGLENQSDFAIMFPDLFFVSSDRMTKIAERAFLNSPKSFSFQGADYYPGIMKFKYGEPQSARKEKAKTVERVVKTAAEEIRKTASDDYEKTKAAHDYLISRVNYDKTITGENLVELSSSHDAYGALAKGVAVCDGYAKALKLLLDELGVSSLLIYGKGKGVPHAWNMVKINGKYYHIDTTWNDQNPDFDVDFTLYFYFLTTDEMISKNHEWEKIYPKAESTEDNYFFRNNLVCKGVEELKREVKRTLQTGESDLQLLLWNFPHKEASIRAWIAEAVRESGVRIHRYTYMYDDESDFLLISFNEEEK